MKRNILIILLSLFACFVLMLSSCDDAGKHTVSFVTNCDTVLEPITVDNGKKVPSPVELSKAGYTLDGWYLGTEKWSFIGYAVTEDITLVAKWVANENTVVFDANDGVGTMENMTIATDSTYSLTPNSFTKSGYTFVGWATMPDGEAEYADSAEYAMGTEPSYTLYAVWEAKKNTLAFNANGGVGAMENMTVTTNTTAILTHNAFTRKGYAFIGWSTSKNGDVEYADGDEYKMNTNSSYTIYAVWKANENTLAFDANGGVGTMENMTIATDATHNLILNSFTKPGYTFVGWATAPDGEVAYQNGSIYKMGAEPSYTLYAIWDSNQNTIVFDANSGEGTTENMTVKTDNTAVLNANTFTKAGYSFVGWATTSDGEVVYTDGAEYTMGTEPSYTLYAVWEAKKNTLVFNANGGVGAMENMTVTTNTTAILTHNTFTREGYTFIGWSTSKNGDVEYTDGAEYKMGTNSSYTIYAVWEAIPYTINFQANGGTINGGYIEFTIENLPLALKSPYKTNYTFVGWCEKEDLSDTPITKLTSIGNKTLYAKYEYGTQGLVYVKKGNSYEITSYTGIESEIIIPTTHNEMSVISIGSSAFKNCNITSLSIPNSIISIGSNAFYNCTSITSINYLGTIDQWCNIRFYNSYANPLCNGASYYLNNELVTDLVIPEWVANINDFAFYNCCSITSVVIPNSTQTIGTTPFYGCPIKSATIPTTAINSIYQKNLKTVVITGGERIDTYAFHSCSSLTSVTIGASVTTIGEFAFSSCASLASIVIPYNITSIGKNAFAACSSLKSIIFENTNGWYRTMTSGATSGIAVDGSVFENESTAAWNLSQAYFMYYWYRT